MKWVKGQSGNPAGRPKLGGAISDLIRKELDQVNTILDPNERRLAKEVIAKSIIDQAMAGDKWCVRRILEYTEGYPTQKTEIQGEIVIHIDRSLDPEFVEEPDEDEVLPEAIETSGTDSQS